MKQEYNLKPVTNRSIQVFKKHGLLDIDKSNLEKAENSYRIYGDTAAIQELAETIFQGDFSKTNWEEFDLSELSMGIQGFLLQLAGRSAKSAK